MIEGVKKKKKKKKKPSEGKQISGYWGKVRQEGRFTKGHKEIFRSDGFYLFWLQWWFHKCKHVPTYQTANFISLGLHPWHMEVAGQARGWIGTITASLHHSHSNSRSRPYLGSTPQLTATLSEARDQIQILMDTSQVRFPCATTGNPQIANFKYICSYYGNTSIQLLRIFKQKDK